MRICNGKTAKLNPFFQLCSNDISTNHLAVWIVQNGRGRTVLGVGFEQLAVDSAQLARITVQKWVNS